MNVCRNSQRLLIGTLLLTTLSTDLIVGYSISKQHLPDETSFRFVVYLGLVFTQLAIMGGWLVYGRGTSVLRLATVLLFIWMLTWPFSEGSTSILSRALFVLGTYIVSVTLPLATFHLLGFQLKMFNSKRSRISQLQKMGPRFSLSSIVTWMTAICLTMGIFPHTDIEWKMFGKILCYLAPFTFTTFVNFWSIFVCRHGHVRWMLPFLVCPLISGLVGMTRLPESGFQSFAGTTFIVSTYLGLSLFLLHNRGCRLVRTFSLSINGQTGVHTTG